MGIPTLGICFGHQLLCHALGASVERAESMSSGVWELALNSRGSSDELFSGIGSGEGGAPCAILPPDHVTTVPESCLLLGSAEHNRVTAVRVMDDNGMELPAWGFSSIPKQPKRGWKEPSVGAIFLRKKWLHSNVNTTELGF